MGITIRAAEMSDAASITPLTIQLGYPITEFKTMQHLGVILKNPEESVWLAVDGEHVIGWIHIFHAVRLESGSFCELGGLIVEEKYRGRGIGKMLIEEAMRWCVSRGVKSLRLRSNVIRHRAHEFYFRLGFKELKEQKVLEIVLDG